MKALLAGVAVVLAALAVTVEPARACSCVQPDPWAILPKADGAFVGRLVSRRETDQGQAVLSFSVERGVKGKIGTTVEVTTANNSAACGIEMSVGHRTALFLLREGGRWFGHMCWQVEPEDLFAAAALPAPNGQGPVALFVGGRFGPARTLALDAQGRTLAYGLGSGGMLLSPCPGGERLAEIATRSSELIIREASTLRVIRQEAVELPERDYVNGLLCEDAAGSSVVVFAPGPGVYSSAGAAMYRLADGRLTTIWKGAAFGSSLNPGVAYLNEGEYVSKLVAVDLRTGRVTGIAGLPRQPWVVPDAKSTRLAGVAHSTSERSRVVLLDLSARPVSVRWTALAARDVPGRVFWLKGRRFLFVPLWTNRELARVFDINLRTRSRFRWRSQDAALVGSTVFGIDLRGPPTVSRAANSLVSAKLPAGRERVVRRLPGRAILIVSASR